MSKVIMQVKNITKKFPASNNRFLTACDNIHLNINAGETVGIVGESGCGKSTLAKMIMNIYKPTSGEIIYHNQYITKLKGEDLRQNYRHIQMVFQDPISAFNPKMKIGNIICEPLLNFKSIKKSQMKEKAKELLRLVELPEDFIDRYPHNLSGGQRQRVAIARALALEPKIIVCDEATSALDVSVQAKIIELLVKLQREKNITYIFICHDLALVSLFSHRIAVMYLGNIVEKIDGNKLTEAKHPYTKALLKAVFSLDNKQNKNIETLFGDIPSPLDLPKGCPFQNRCKYCKDICKQEKPKLKEISANHHVACHLF